MNRKLISSDEAVPSSVQHVLRKKQQNRLYEAVGRRAGDYFPLPRFGDRVVIGRRSADDGGDIVQFHESKSDADKAVRELSAMKDVTGVTTKMRTEYERDARASAGFVGDLQNLIDKNNALTAEQKDMLRSSVSELWLKSLPELSGAKRRLSRRNVAGYSEDLARSYASSITSSARYVANISHLAETQAAMESARWQTSSSQERTASVVVGRDRDGNTQVRITAPGTDRLDAVREMQAAGHDNIRFAQAVPSDAKETIAELAGKASPEDVAQWQREMEEVVKRSEGRVTDLRKASQLLNQMQHLETLDGRVEPKIISGLGRVGFLYFLTSPATWLVNLTQNITTGIPHLGAKYGVDKSTVAIGKSMAQATRILLTKGRWRSNSTFSVKDLTEADGLTRGELTMLAEMERQGRVDFTRTHDLNRIARGEHTKTSTWMRALGLGMHDSEVINRIAYALASYRLALGSMDGSVDATTAHNRAVERTGEGIVAVHGDYADANAPAVMRSGPAKLLMMFQKFAQNQLYWWGRNAREMFKGETPEVRREARQALLWGAAMQTLMGGVVGLPLMGTLQLIAAAFGRDDDDQPIDLRNEMIQFARKYLGETAGDMLSRGVLAGFGVDLSTRVRAPDIPVFGSDMAYSLRRGLVSGEYEKAFRNWAFEQIGPLGSIADGMFKGLDQAQDGNLLGAANAVAPTAVRNIVAAVQLGMQGVTDSQGRTLMQDVSKWALAQQAIGFQPLEVKDVKDARYKLLDKEKGLTRQAKNLVASYVLAWQHQDQDGMNEALDDIRAFNEKMAGRKLGQFAVHPGAIKSAIVGFRNKQMISAMTGGTAQTRREMRLMMEADGTLDGEAD